MRRTLGRIAHEILEANGGAGDLVVMGVLRRGWPIAKRLAFLMSQIEGVTACEWSPRTRSLLVRYQPERTAPDPVLAVIGHHAGVPAARPRAATPGEPLLATAVRDVIADVNGRVSRWTGGALDLAARLPLSLTLWALREIGRGQVAPLAWSTALWYAHGLFRDYSRPASPPARPGA